MSMDIKNPNATYLLEAEARMKENDARADRNARRHGKVIVKVRGTRRVNPNPDPLPEGGLTVEWRKR